jgi:excisionase family DNA binding protein
MDADPKFHEWLAAVEKIEPADIPSVLLQLAAAQSMLASRLLQDNNGGHQESATGRGKLLTVEEAAQRTGMSKDWLYRNRSTLPFAVKVGRSVRFSESLLEKWIRSRGGR